MSNNYEVVVVSNGFMVRSSRDVARQSAAGEWAVFTSHTDLANFFKSVKADHDTVAEAEAAIREIKAQA